MFGLFWLFVLAAETSALRIALLSTFEPQKCGIAMFSQFLVSGIQDPAVEIRIFVLDNPLYNVPASALLNGSSLVAGVVPLETNNFAEFAAKIDSMGTSLLALTFLFSQVPIGFDGILVQHEFAMWLEIQLGPLLCMFSTPVVTILHTVLRYPQEHELNLICGIAECSKKVVALTKSSAKSLTNGYGISPSKVVYVPHGVPMLSLEEIQSQRVEWLKRNFGVSKADNTTIILTNGLLHPSKGLHYSIEAIAVVVERLRRDDEQGRTKLAYYIVGKSNGQKESELYMAELQSTRFLLCPWDGGRLVFKKNNRM